ncbi:Dihydrolipoyllysine-residue acetyltransferase component of pyruvate dehydrogenase complex [bioreactor metagenome]|uniref:Dihydrolipoyllysine-residue acetyltransferase component of pyruvate dehydrogenase complex n=1 Tax=bioreactor metagenome TaxID=1076179 RepID=A0A644WFL1_9ZZZZ
MRYIFSFPDIGEGLDEGTILEWYVSKGQEIKSGQPVVKMETDKVVADIPSPKSGIIVARFGNIGETIHVGAPLVEIEIAEVFGEDAVAEAKTPVVIEPLKEDTAGVVGTIEVAAANAFLPASDEGFAVPKTESKRSQKVLSTPVARALAKELEIDINSVSGTGPGGRVTKNDIQAFHANMRETKDLKPYSPATGNDAFTYEPLSQIRKTIARNMLNSKHNAAHMTVFEEVEISDLIWIREKYKKVFAEKNVRLTFLPFILKATVLALKRHPQLNSQMDTENNRMIYKNFYNIGIAVDTIEGLVVPVIKGADGLSIFQIAQKISGLAEKAKDRKLTLEEINDGTFTLTNYGSVGGIFGVPVINYPQAGILGIGRILEKPVVKDGQIVVGHVLPLSLTVDHRIVDGGEATRFLLQIMEYLKDPFSLMME